jgi:hypothetical protein
LPQQSWLGGSGIKIQELQLPLRVLRPRTRTKPHNGARDIPAAPSCGRRNRPHVTQVADMAL